MGPDLIVHIGIKLMIYNNIFRSVGLNARARRPTTNALHLEPQSPVDLDDAPSKEVVLEDKPDRMGNFGRLA
jgi:hypothetical protein